MGLILNLVLYGSYFPNTVRKTLSSGPRNASASRVTGFYEDEGKDKQRRFPHALIIGFSKCGTTALRAFLSLHPDIVSPLEEVRFFTLNYTKGLEWYRMQMPPSTEHQITIEKTPFYIMYTEALERIRQFNSSIKLIISVRDPIARLQSQYAHTFRNVRDASAKPTFRSWCHGEAAGEHVVRFVDYATHISTVYNLFPRDQVLVLSEEVLETDPLSVMKEAETFLGLRPSFSKHDFVFNQNKGFYCFNMTSPSYPKIIGSVKVNSDTGCIGGEKGRAHPEIDDEFFKHLVQAIRPYNEQLFQLINKRFEWANFIQ
ncbi:heparan sulfate glucosamine 3-o-sulfotransferase 5 [Plakobranchus ocellatus]|uniref:Heparan sulfate glucosamine 3-o-sulfotransferase 5 n=1 Tax=Plakobranchus ocellatus TaxID=259542 RepID=A0AAV4CT06_9GAST|nr:heparan sulfate glucosamine 3-o-sulfotransferase 5 [Plakobranchus ocellatus]